MMAAATFGSPAVGSVAEDDALDRAIAFRAAYGFDDDRAFVRGLMQEGAHPVSEEYGFPLTRSEVGELERRNQFVAAVAKSVVPYVRGLDSFAGVWIDQKAGGELVVMLTNVTASTRDSVRNRLPVDSLGVRFEEVDDSWTSLNRALEVSDKEWADLGTNIEPQAFNVDERANRLTVKILRKDLDVARGADLPFERRVGVDVGFEGTPPIVDMAPDYSRCDERWQCYGPFLLGIRIFYGEPGASWRCGMGFQMKHDTNSNLNQTFLTAGHCGYNRSGNWHHSDAFQEAYGRIGEKVSSRYTSDNRDLMLVSIDDWPQNKSKKIFGEAQTSMEMLDADNLINGEQLCMSLSQTNQVYCGTADTSQQKWKSSTANIWVWGAGIDFGGSQSITFGDSGSPIYRRNCTGTPLPCFYTPIGIVHAGTEVEQFDEPHDVYFAKVAWAVNNADGWPGLYVYTGAQGVGGPP